MQDEETEAPEENGFGRSLDWLQLEASSISGVIRSSELGHAHDDKTGARQAWEAFSS